VTIVEEEEKKGEEEVSMIPYPNESGFIPTTDTVLRVQRFREELRFREILEIFIGKTNIQSIKNALSGVGVHEIEYGLEMARNMELKEPNS